MIPAILSMLATLFSVVGKIFDWLNARQLVDLAKTSQELANLKAQVDAAHQAVKIREGVRDALQRNPDSIMSDDEFTRPE